MARRLLIFFGITILFTVGSVSSTAQTLSPTVTHAGVSAATPFLASSNIDLPTTSLPRMAPELAFQVYSQRTADQPKRLEEYTDRTIVEAELPDTKQRGEYELIRSYRAPDSLNYASIKFTGDSFVKSNVITKLLQSEVDHVRKGDSSETAINDRNYKISYKGVDDVAGAPTHVYQLKPRHKIPGLFKGKIYLDVYTGSLRRAEGTMIKSPSFFVKKIEFVQDFGDFAGVTLPTELRSVSKARIVGRAVVRIFHRNYELKTANIPATIPATTTTPVALTSRATGNQ